LKVGWKIKIKILDEIKTYIEKIYKEYVSLKNYLKSKEKEIEEVKKEIAQTALTDLNAESYFDKIGWYSIMQIQDLELLRARLFFTMEAYKDIIEPPKELKEEIDKELQNTNYTTVYAIIDNERKIVDQIRYDKNKENFLQVIKMQNNKEQTPN